MDQGESLAILDLGFLTCKMGIATSVALSGWTNQMGLTVLLKLERTM